MPERRNRPRRPAGWSALLRKGHVHERSRASERAGGRWSVDDALAEYEDEYGEDHEPHESNHR